MANYTAADIKALRERTGAGMMDVKKALDEANGDAEKAIEIIRIKGLKGATKREGRSTAEGLVAAKVSNGVGVMIEVNCETDFVAKADKFIQLADKVLAIAVESGAADLETLLATEVDGKPLSEVVVEEGAILGEKVVVRRISRIEGGTVDAVEGEGEAAATAAHDVAVHIAAMAPNYLTREDVPSDLVESERRIAEETAKAEGKPEAALTKIVEGRVTGFYKGEVLVDQAFAKDAKKSVAQVLEEAGVKGTAFTRFRVGS
jgi:elongation factor Ts